MKPFIFLVPGEGFIKIKTCNTRHDHDSERCIPFGNTKYIYYLPKIEALSKLPFLKFLSFDNKVKRAVKKIERELEEDQATMLKDYADAFNEAKKCFSMVEADLENGKTAEN